MPGFDVCDRRSSVYVITIIWFKSNKKNKTKKHPRGNSVALGWRSHGFLSWPWHKIRMTLGHFPLEAFQELLKGRVRDNVVEPKPLKQLFFPSGMEMTVDARAACLHDCSLIPDRQIIIDELPIPPFSINLKGSYWQNATQTTFQLSVSFLIYYLTFIYHYLSFIELCFCRLYF